MNLLIYFQSQAFAEDYALNGTPHKKATYKHFFSRLSQKGLTVYVGNQDEGYLGQQVFHKLLRFENDTFTPVSESVRIDCIFDRSSSKNSPPLELITIMYNALEFRAFCESKARTYEILHKYMPKSSMVRSSAELSVALNAMRFYDKVVMKPVFGMKGKGIIIESPRILLKKNLYIDNPFLIQEFIDTSYGIPSVTDTYHDIRAIIINNACVLTSIRTPKEGNLLANVAQGGSIREIPLESLPKNTPAFLADVIQIIQQQFHNPFYSIDFCFNAQGKSYIFELNDRIGFPLSTMEHAMFFAEELAEAIHLFSLTLSHSIDA